MDEGASNHDTLLLPTDINYHRDHLAIVQNNFPAIIRLGDGTETSHKKMQEAIDDLWMFSGELCTFNATDTALAEAGIAPDLHDIDRLVQAKLKAVLEEATLSIPENSWMQSGGKEGRHSEHLGFMLAEMQHIQRTYPGLQW